MAADHPTTSLETTDQSLSGSGPPSMSTRLSSPNKASTSSSRRNMAGARLASVTIDRKPRSFHQLHFAGSRIPTSIPPEMSAAKLSSNDLSRATNSDIFNAPTSPFSQGGQRRQTPSANVHVCTDTLSRIRVINPCLLSHGSHLQSASFQVNSCLDNRVNSKRVSNSHTQHSLCAADGLHNNQEATHNDTKRISLDRKDSKHRRFFFAQRSSKFSDIKLREGAASETVINKAYLKTNSLTLDSNNDPTNFHNKSTDRATKTRHGGARRSSRRVQAARLGRGNTVPRHSTTEPDLAWSSGATAVLHRNRPIPPSLRKNMTRVPCHRPDKTRDRLLLLPVCQQDVPRESYIAT